MSCRYSEMEITHGLPEEVYELHAGPLRCGLDGQRWIAFNFANRSICTGHGSVDRLPSQARDRQKLVEMHIKKDLWSFIARHSLKQLNFRLFRFNNQYIAAFRDR